MDYFNINLFNYLDNNLVFYLYNKWEVAESLKDYETIIETHKIKFNDLQTRKHKELCLQIMKETKYFIIKHNKLYNKDKLIYSSSNKNIYFTINFDYAIFLDPNNIEYKYNVGKDFNLYFDMFIKVANRLLNNDNSKSNIDLISDYYESISNSYCDIIYKQIFKRNFIKIIKKKINNIRKNSLNYDLDKLIYNYAHYGHYDDEYGNIFDIEKDLFEYKSICLSKILFDNDGNIHLLENISSAKLLEEYHTKCGVYTNINKTLSLDDGTYTLFNYNDYNIIISSFNIKNNFKDYIIGNEELNDNMSSFLKGILETSENTPYSKYLIHGLIKKDCDLSDNTILDKIVFPPFNIDITDETNMSDLLSYHKKIYVKKNFTVLKRKKSLIEQSEVTFSSSDDPYTNHEYNFDEMRDKQNNYLKDLEAERNAEYWREAVHSNWVSAQILNGNPNISC